jgi:hypothetical protein
MNVKVAYCLLAFWSLGAELRAACCAGPNDIITTIGGNGSSGYVGDAVPAVSGGIGDSAFQVVVDGAGNVYYSCLTEYCIRKIDASGIVRTVAGNGLPGYSGDGGPALAATMDEPWGLALDAVGNVYFCDPYDNVVRKVDTTSGVISTYVGTGIGAYSGDGGPATAAELYSPNYIVFDTAGNLYISDTGNNVIRKVDSAGIISTFAGVFSAPGYGGDGGPASAANINSPAQVALDPAGNLYFRQYLNVIRKVDPSGTIGTWATGLPGINALAFCATGLIGNDLTDSTVVSLPLGISTVLAGTAGSPGFGGDGGPASGAFFNLNVGVTVDGLGNIYVVDSGNHRIRKISVPAACLPTTTPTPSPSVTPTPSLALKDLLSLGALYPNPFSDRVHVFVTLKAAAHLTMDIYNVAGESIGSSQSDLPAGKGELVWKGQNSSGARCGSGIYPLHVTAESADHTRGSFWTSAAIAR